MGQPRCNIGDNAATEVAPKVRFPIATVLDVQGYAAASPIT